MALAKSSKLKSLQCLSFKEILQRYFCFCILISDLAKPKINRSNKRINPCTKRHLRYRQALIPCRDCFQRAYSFPDQTRSNRLSKVSSLTRPSTVLGS